MNKSELITKLENLGVNSNSYSLDGFSKEGLILEHSCNHYGDGKTYDEWRVFYSEKGNRSDDKPFYSIEEAYDEIYERFRKLHE